MKKNYKMLSLALVFAFLACFAARAQGLVKGTIKDETGATVPGANILVKGTTYGTISDINGSFSIEAAPEDVLVISFIGYATQEIAVGTQTNIDVSIDPDLTTLNELVVVGYGTQQRKDVTGAISTISSKQFELQPVNRLDQALQGRAPGVQVSNNSGAPGGDVKIRIRGSNSIAGGNEPLYVVDGFVGADFKNVNPDDIASIQILKDASSTAIYGSRGANGVVLITTKIGSNDEMKVSFTSRYTTSSIIKKYDLLSPLQFAETVNMRDGALGLDDTFIEAELESIRTTGGTDWQDEVFRTAGGNEQLLNVSGGNAKTSYYISGNYFDQDGTIINSGFKRYGFRTNLSSNLNDRLSMRLNFSAMRRENLNSAGNLGRLSPVTQALSWAPTTPVRDANNNYTKNDPVGSLFENPVALGYEVDRNNISNVGNLVGGFNYQIIEGLTFDIGYGLNYESFQIDEFRGVAILGQANALRYADERITLQNTNRLNYSTNFNEDHALTVTAVFEQQSYKLRGFEVGASNLTFPALGPDNISNLNETGVITPRGTYENTGLRSYLGRVNYAFKNKYLLTASVRHDASSKFREDNQSSIFPSVGLGWRLSEEAFLKDLDLFSELKLRAGYGVTGNQGLPAYGTSSRYVNTFTTFNNSSITSGILLGAPGNPDLKWETTAQYNIGLDVEIRGITMGLDYYKKNTSDLLLREPVPKYAGGGEVFRNVGETTNSGFEFFLAGAPIKSNGFVWETSFNFATLKNEVVSLGDRERILTNSRIGAGLSSQDEFVLIPGEALGSIWGVRYLGTWKPEEADEAALFGSVPGDSRYEDLNVDNAITGEDFQIIGNGIPQVSLGWNNSFFFKGFSLNLFFQSLLKYDKLNYLYGATVSPSADLRQATNAEVLDRYIPGVNETSDIPAFSATDLTILQSTRFVQRGDFLRLKNISLSYDVPSRFLGGLDLKVFIGGTNLLTFTKYKGFDPESSSVTSDNDMDQGIDYGSYPNPKSYVAGLTFKF